MQILRHYEDVPADLRGGVAVLGNFDGVHRGHQAVFARTCEIAQDAGVPLVAVTFEPHPRSFFRPQDPPFRLTPFRNKAHHIENLGFDLLLVLHFDETMHNMTAEAFVRDVLVGGLDASHVVVGYDFVFGHNRAGDTAFLATMGARCGFGVTVVEPVRSERNGIYSSTLIRDHLRAGRPAEAAVLLGRPFEFEGRVGHGNAMGRDLGYPTANLSFGEYLRPAYGIYAVRVGIDWPEELTWHDGVASFGIRPTIGEDEEPVLEAYIFDFSGDLYGLHLRIQLIDYIRPELKFDGLEALTAQIEDDCRVARAILAAAAGHAPS
ncbi:MAG: bifunctional riboflavin kinase/FAD synthetase [Alphaproteobacteria bacterium]|nr:bifunctional riboflavin kinase/FAD synthetase [Alphaproteobacteria bacterium]